MEPTQEAVIEAIEMISKKKKNKTCIELVCHIKGEGPKERGNQKGCTEETH